MGDSFLAIFRKPRKAILCAAAMQRALASGEGAEGFAFRPLPDAPPGAESAFAVDYPR